ncbi:hypothetical protein KKG05_00325 [bacterium]|nr:hypothetical protein [bacterium]
MEKKRRSLLDRRAIQRGRQTQEAGFTVVEFTLAMMMTIVLMAVTANVFQGVMQRSALESKKDEARADGRLIVKRLDHNMRLIGLMAPLDVNGDSNDVNTDVTGQTWTDSVRDDFEYVMNNELVFTSDYDNDGKTETVWIWRNDLDLHETVWEWSRDSMRWSAPTDRILSRNVERLLFRFYDRYQNTVPKILGQSGGGSVLLSVPLTSGERRLVTELEMILILRSDFEDKQRKYYTMFPDGTSAHDGYQRFWLTTRVRGRNLALG